MPATLLDEQQKQQQARPEPSKTRSLWIRRVTFAALGLFLALNTVLWVKCGNDKVSHDMWSGVGSIDVAVDCYNKVAQKPKVVLMGSSLMMYPFWSVDKERNPSIGDIFHHRESIELASALAEPAQPKPLVYSFAIFGQMISDGYLYVDQFLKGDKAPEYVVLGIAPRDFHDSDLSAPMATYSFKRLVTLTNFFDYARMYLPTFQDQADFVLGRSVFFYGRRWRLQKEVNHAFEKVYAVFGIKSPVAEQPRTQAGFMLAAREDVRWDGSKNEYARRYRGIDTSKDVALQLAFLHRVLDLCSKRNIKVVLVNMPLSDINRGLLPAGFYEQFRQDLAAAANRQGVKYLDLGSDPSFTHADFWDTSHLNNSGGHKLIDRIKPLLAS